MSARALPRRLFVGKIAGTHAFVHVSLLLWPPVLWFGLLDYELLAALFAAAIVHEAAHAATASWLNLGGGSIVLWALGGVFIPTALSCAPSQLEKAARRRFVAVVAAGPVSNLMLGGLLYALSLTAGFSVLRQASIISMSVGLLNLLPIPPLDGERLLLMLTAEQRSLSRSSIHYILGVVFAALAAPGLLMFVLDVDGPWIFERWYLLYVAGAVTAFKLGRVSDVQLDREFVAAVASERTWNVRIDAT